MSRHFLLSGLAIVIGFFCFGHPQKAQAASLLFRYQHHLFTIESGAHPEWRQAGEKWMLNGQHIVPPSEWRSEGDAELSLPAGIVKNASSAWNTDAIAVTLRQQIASSLDRPVGKVTISRSATGAIAFEGVGLTGRAVQVEQLSRLVAAALEGGIRDLWIPVIETQPSITVTDPGLVKEGITEVVTVGESNFAGSPVNRRHNIRVGLSKFNGSLIPRGSVFSFNKILGNVDATTGYRKELVIKGDRTEPEFGGGLCQISTTAYRGVWEYGFPILKRQNHSYAVSYYGPQGTDATVFLPNPDMHFKNDGPSSLLIQTYEDGDHAYFIYYGTRDTRKSLVWGPVVSDRKEAPPDRTIYTTEIPPGEKKKVGDRHPGMTVLWYRVTKPASEPAEKVEPVLSIYEARPLFYEVGVTSLPGGSAGGSAIDAFADDAPAPPDWVGR